MIKLRKWFVLFLAASQVWIIPVSAAVTRRTKAQGQSESIVLEQKRKATRGHLYVGNASWYGKQHQGKRMANGERFDRRKFTAASRFLPLGTRCVVRFPLTGRAVLVVITDRGPYRHPDRIIDLSEAAADVLGLKPCGIGAVELEVVEAQTVTVDIG